MKLRTACLALLVVLSFSCSPAVASFYQNVVQRAEQLNRYRVDTEESIEDALLSKAIPLKDFEAQLEASGATLSRRLEEDEDKDEDEDGDAVGDDYYMDADYMYSFSGWSLKYSKCQAIQRFSEEAVQNGEYSALVKDDVVILRLCPRRVCSSGSSYGCHYNYAEYAIGLGEYLKIMIKYTIDKRRNLCNFCSGCNYFRRKLDEEDDRDEEDEDKEEEEQGEEEEQEEDNKEEADQQDNAANDDYYGYDDDDVGGGGNNDDGDYVANNDDDGGCSDYYDTCSELASWCDGEDDDGVYLDIADYLDYLQCVQVDGQGNYEDTAYWARPYCDPSKEVIKMSLFSDPYCSQAIKEINLRDFSGLYFKSSLFEDFYSGTCIDCSESNYPPYYNAGSYMCNNLHAASARCTSNMVYDLFDGQDQSESKTECSFIESVQLGTYDKDGAVSSKNSDGETIAQEVTPFQKAGLIISLLMCFALGVYACVLHHQITNLLIKSLSHSSLLPPVKRRSRGSGSRSSGSRKRLTKNQGDGRDDDWDHEEAQFGLT